MQELTIDDLYKVLQEWDASLKKQISLFACGGTAITIYGHKESTKDVDLLIPSLEEYELLVKTLKKLGYVRKTADSYGLPGNLWRFDLFRGNTIFQTELLDPVQDEGHHREIKKFKYITLNCITPVDLIISKMFRGDGVDVEDCMTLITKESVDLELLASRFKETADYYIQPKKCKFNFQLLIDELDRQQISCNPLKQMMKKWNP